MCAYNLIVHREDGAYWAEVPALPGCYADGATLEELEANALEAIRFHLGSSPEDPSRRRHRSI